MVASGFPARLAAFLAVAVLAATLAAAALWTVEQNRRLHAAAASHAGFVLGEIKTALEARLNLGLALADLPQVPPLLDDARGDLPAILSVSVLDEAGTVMFSNAPVEVGERIAGLPRDREPGALWSLARDGERLYGIGLTTSFDTEAGTVLLRLPGDVSAEQTRRFALRLAIGGLALAVPLAVLAWLVGMRLTRGPRRAVCELAEALEALAQEGQDVPPAAEPLPAFAEAVRGRLALITAAERDVARLDEMA